MNNTAFILTLAYPETIVSHAEEWYSPLLKYVGIGNKTSVRAGHSAIVLINKKKGVLEYHDFGRYITPEPNGRVRGPLTDNELQFPIQAEIKHNEILNLDAILHFLATQPKLTHGDGRLIASVCDAIDYDKAKKHINKMQARGFIYYAAFKKEACNCARFVVDALTVSVNNKSIKKKLKHSKWFTPSTVGNVLFANTNAFIFEVTAKGEISNYKGSQKKENIKCFLDRLKGYKPNLKGTLEPRIVKGLSANAQWLPGIAAGAWYELNETEIKTEYRYKRISPYGNVDVDAVFLVEDSSFNFKLEYTFVHYSNCLFFHVAQGEKTFRFNKKD